MNMRYQNFLIRDWQPRDRIITTELIKTALVEYGLPWQPKLADRDVIEVELAYQDSGGEFWVIEENSAMVGTAAYLPISRGRNAVEIRKMYLLPHVRNRGLGLFLLKELEKAIAIKDYQEIWLETSSALKEAVVLYERNGYQSANDVETQRCDLAYFKRLNH